MLNVLFALASGILLACSFVFCYMGTLAYVALAPVIYVIAKENNFRAYCYSLISGVTAVGIANYWIYSFVDNLTSSISTAIAAFALYIIYSGHVICLVVLTIKWLCHYLPYTVYFFVAPLVCVSVMSLYPLIFDFNLALTQVGYPKVLQPVALLGQWSLTAFIVYINLHLAELANSNFSWKTQKYSIVSILSAFLVWLLLSYLSLGLYTFKMGEHTPLSIGFHQTLDKPNFSNRQPDTGYTFGYPKEIADSRVLAAKGAEVIIWPESRPKGLVNQAWVMESYKEYARSLGAAFIVQDLSRSRSGANTYVNASMYISPNGTVDIHNKVVRIPFGEVIPELLDRGWLGGWVRRLFKDIHKELIRHTEAKIFVHNSVNILPQICYEFLDEGYVLRTIKKHPEIQLIIAQSNDNWFFSEKQVYMHNAYGILRAVETRRPLVHVVNSGPSFVINALGEVVSQTAYNTEGAYLTQLQIPKKTESTLYAATGSKIFMAFCYLISGVVFVYCLFNRIFCRKL